MTTININNPAVYTDNANNPTSGADVLGDLDTVFNEVNAKETRITNLESGTMNITGVKTFVNGIIIASSGTPASSTFNGAVSIATASGTLTVASGVTVTAGGLTVTAGGATVTAGGITVSAGGAHITGGTNTDTLVATGLITGQAAILISQAADPVTPTDGTVWYNSAIKVLKSRVNGTSEPVVMQGNIPGFITGLVPTYSTGTTLSIAAGACSDSTNAQTITATAAIPVNAGVNGAGGLDTGALAASGWYYLWMIGKSTDATAYSAILSASSTAPTMPATYDLKRLLPFAILVGGSSFVPWVVAEGWPRRPVIMYRDDNGGYTALSNSDSATWFVVGCSNYVPTLSRMAVMGFFCNGQGASGEILYVRQNGTSSGGKPVCQGASSYVSYNNDVRVPLDSSQSFQAITSTTVSGFTGFVSGFVVTEVA